MKEATKTVSGVIVVAGFAIYCAETAGMHRLLVACALLLFCLVFKDFIAAIFKKAQEQDRWSAEHKTSK